ncbi:4-(cytidine 5'-diphospho)-2-C-methyl-D-erythritol kinase [Chitinophaga pinensis]|uniref:4-diphosphocytidyl-2-C-methyl-D-erythritol kinase n=1 Tax=Chitinophaga pinensis (strain ATCC 43595 / DSM 2588 / LMG 13176 / NBRC 15968 / NCIMB 11800 / UQM 2034) TaxID=485918 RepID=A0A979GV82_CHIPD|nr:4-(cytidine 5'-diphospho)-2-C-methyl-D-erythritol kinase [Chitinophaga pinensis]ACU61219.1 4-diphosphocytidyl-2C-methyl-D-erythritolkinase [Chitinophaga pinensis DSM 2588]
MVFYTMIVFPNCKINLGLHVVSKRPDGFHELETVFYPLPLTDALEVLSPGKLSFTTSGIHVPGDQTDNLCLKAWRLLKQDFPELPEVNIHLHKNIPIGAGLGGGSADAAFMLQLLNNRFQLDLSKEQLISYAAILGSDCPFFIENKAVYATGRGEIMQPISLDLSGWSFVLVYPAVHINTGWAFGRITPQAPAHSLQESIMQPLETWKDTISNDFEAAVFPAHPELATIKEKLYTAGAVYAAMSGSGSAFVGIFPKNNIGDLHFDPAYKVFVL